jgi:rhodanese-related sulfurtransferase
MEHRLEFILQNIFLVFLAAGSGAALIVLTVRGAGGKTGLSPTQATLLINREDARVIDVRNADEYATGHLPESQNIPLDQLETRASEIDHLKDTPLIVVCQTGARSAGACKQLEKLGFGKVGNLAGGIGGWRAAGLPVRKGAKK